MKKTIVTLLIIALLPAMAVNSQTTKRNFKKLTATELITASDSVNYAIGYATGVQNRINELKNDTLKLKNIISFCMGLESAYKEKDANKTAKVNGYSIAQSIMNIVNGEGVQILPIEGFKLNIDSLSKGLICAITNNNEGIDFSEYSKFINENVFSPLQKGETVNLTKSLQDSISTFFGYVNGKNVLEQMVKTDTDANLINTLVNSYKSYIYNNNKITSFNKGEVVGHMLWEQLGKETNFFNSDKFAINKTMLLNGLFDGILKNPKSAFTFDEAKNYIDSVNTKIQQDNIAAQQKIAEDIAVKNQQEGFAFLQNNGMRPEVTTTKSGLQYEIIKQGDGKIPTESNTVKVHYEGKLIDGTIFDSSIKRGEPIEFVPTQVIKGWTEGLQLMPVGSKYIFYIPYDLAYGPNGAGGVIPPYATLIFEVELLEIVK